MAKEKDPLMFEMKEAEQEEIVQKVDHHNLDMSLMEGVNYCQSNCLSDPQATALTALQSRQLRLFADAVNDDRFDVSHHYPTSDGFPKTLLSIAIDQWEVSSATASTQFVSLLLSCGAKLDEVDEASEVSPLHLVVRKRSPELMRAALAYVVGGGEGATDINVKDGEGLTPLHAAVEHLQESDEEQRRSLLEIIQLLLKTSDVEVNAEDLRGGLTPLYYAATSGCREAVELLLEHGADPGVAIEGQNIREVIEEHLPGFDFLAYADRVKERPLLHRLFKCAETNDVNGLKRIAFYGGSSIDWNSSNGASTLLQLACLHGYEKVVQFLIQRDCDLNLNTPTEPRSPILIAAHHGYYKVLDVFRAHPKSNFAKVESGTGKTVLHEVFRCDSAKYLYLGGRDAVPTSSSYSKCLKILLGRSLSSNPNFERQIDSIINFQEELDGNTALHYATMQADQEIVKLFLRRGANMGVKNNKDKTAVQSILPETLSEFLDSCVEGKGIITDEDFKITFKYDFLAPPILSEEMSRELEASSQRQQQQQKGDEAGGGGADEDSSPHQKALPETEALWYLSEASKEHKALLKHPVIASFLWLKWQRIRTLFYINLILYLTFVILLTSFIFIRFGGFAIQPHQSQEEEQQQQKPQKPQLGSGVDEDDETTNSFNNSDPAITTALIVAITVLLVVLSIREVFQMFVSFKRYFFSGENLMELTIIVISFVILFGEDKDGVGFETRRHLAALGVLFSWTEILVLVGRHPRLSTNITMFTTVIWTFFTFLLWYGIVIVAFGISFYIMFHEDHKDGNPNKDYIFFDTIWLCLLKTSSMFVGELEFSNIPFSENPLSHLIFLAFIFLIVVVLMNLLNGLAVSDTGLIRETAEVVGWSSRVDLITYTESMLLGDPFYFLSNWPPIKLLQRIPSCAVCRFLYKFPRIRDLLQKISGGTKILLFYTCLPTKRATFFPNKKSGIGRSILGYKKSLKVDDDVNATAAAAVKQQKLAISNDVLDSAKRLILDRMKAERDDVESRQLAEEMSNRMMALEEIQLQLLTSVNKLKSLIESKEG